MKLDMKKIKMQYEKIRCDSGAEAANVWLLLVELSDENGKVKFEGNVEEQLKVLFDARFNSPEEYAF